MSLFWLLSMCAFQRLFPRQHPLRPDEVLARWVEWTGGFGLLREPSLQLLVVVGVPVLLLHLLLMATSGILQALIGVVAVIYAVDVGEFQERLRFRWPGFGESADDAAGDMQESVGQVDEIVEDEFVSLHVAVFWLFLLGPVGAVAVRLTEQVVGHCEWRQPTSAEDADDPLLSLAERVLWWAEWLAGRGAGLLLALLSVLSGGREALTVFGRMAADGAVAGRDVLAGVTGKAVFGFNGAGQSEGGAFGSASPGRTEPPGRVEMLMNFLLMAWLAVFLIQVLL